MDNPRPTHHRARPRAGNPPSSPRAGPARRAALRTTRGRQDHRREPVRGLTVYDRDDPHWTDDQHFTNALDTLGHTPNARAVVIRSGATSASRARVARQIGATHTRVILADADTLARRVTHRNRADKTRTLAGIRTWLDRYDNNDHAPVFTGWHGIT